MSGEDEMTMARHEPGVPGGRHLSSGRIDVHAHYVPPGLQASVPPAPIFRGFATWGLEAALEVMDSQGIATAILSMVLWTGMFAAPGDAAAAKRWPAPRTRRQSKPSAATRAVSAAFACLPLPDVDAALAEIDYALGTLRLDGVTLLTNHEGVYLGDRRQRLASPGRSRRPHHDPGPGRQPAPAARGPGQNRTAERSGTVSATTLAVGGS